MSKGQVSKLGKDYSLSTNAQRRAVRSQRWCVLKYKVNVACGSRCRVELHLRAGHLFTPRIYVSASRSFYKPWCNISICATVDLDN